MRGVPRTSPIRGRSELGAESRVGSGGRAGCRRTDGERPVRRIGTRWPGRQRVGPSRGRLNEKDRLPW